MVQTRRCAVLLSVLGYLALATPAAWCGGPTPDAVISIQADPCFENRDPDGEYPISVTLTNRGNAVDAEVEVSAQSQYGSGSVHRYLRQMNVPGGGAKTHFIAYAASGPLNGGTLEHVQVSSSYGVQEVTVPLRFAYPSVNVQLCLLGDHPGALARTPHPRREPNPPAGPSYSACYVKPENTPDRPSAFNGLRAVVIGRGAERLNPAQWHALREWAVEGGSLIFLPRTDGFRPPVEIADSLPSGPLTEHMAADLPVGPSGFLKLYTAVRQSPTDNLLSYPLYVTVEKEQLGAGNIVFFSADLTSREFRSSPHLGEYWTELINLAAPFESNNDLIRDGEVTAPWSDASGTNLQMGANGQPTVYRGYPVPPPQQPVSGTDPFELSLPALNSVLYLFLGYFVLAVPVTFVVLKRTRKMNLAWVTGPVLAVGFAGALYLCTARLYTAPLSRRTAGTLVAAAGDHEARFSGMTELFIPHGGTYDFSMPGADSIEFHDRVAADYPGGRIAGDRSLDTWDNGKTLTAPGIETPNLAFRRIRYAQSVGLGSGVTAEWQTGSDPGLLGSTITGGTITNGTGMTLHQARIMMPVNATLKQGTVSVEIGDIPPGTMRLPSTFSGTASQKIAVFVHDARGPGVLFGMPPRFVPTLVAKISGGAYGPTLGTSTGGDRSVNLIVSLPAMARRK